MLLKVARDMEKRYAGLGGRIACRQHVQKIVVRDGRAAGG
jgi:phytoene dehydrogenase-like protein